MSMGGQPLSIDDLTAFTARLDGLRPDQHPDDLSNALRAAFKQRELYDVYASSLVKDMDRAKAFLEVLDKVRPVMRPRKSILSTGVWRRPFRLPRTMSWSSSGFDNSAVGRGFYQPPTSFPGRSSKRLNIPSPPAVLVMFGKAFTLTNE